MSDEVASNGVAQYEEDENYFISMTDMMVGVLFIFIIILMVFALTFRKHTDFTEEQIERLQKAEATAATVSARLSELHHTIEQDITAIRNAESVRSQLLHQIRQRLAEQHLVVDIDDQTGVLHLRDAAISFAPDQYELDATDRQNVGKIAQVLWDVLPGYLNPSDGRGAYLETVFVEGHTDQTGSKEHNWDLSTQRAVRTFLGLRDAQQRLVGLRNRAGSPVFSVSGYADTRPAPDTSPTEYDKQRRIDLRFVMNVDTEQQLEDMKNLTEQMSQRLVDLRRSVESARMPVTEMGDGGG